MKRRKALLHITSALVLGIMVVLAAGSSDGDSSSGSSTSSGSSGPDAIGSAYRVCSALKSIKGVTECSVGVHMSGNTIDVRMNTNASQAETLCPGIVAKVSQVTSSFATAKRKWHVRIYSPYTGSHPLAVCPLN